jgi:hypothetical protein
LCMCCVSAACDGGVVLAPVRVCARRRCSTLGGRSVGKMCTDGLGGCAWVPPRVWFAKKENAAEQFSLREPAAHFVFMAAASTATSVPRRRLGTLVAKGLGALTGAATLGGAYLYQTDEGTRRSMAFWTRCTPIYAHYRWVQWQAKSMTEAEADAAFSALHDRYAPVVEALTLELKGGRGAVCEWPRPPPGGGGGGGAATRGPSLPLPHTSLSAQTSEPRYWWDHAAHTGRGGCCHVRPAAWGCPWPVCVSASVSQRCAGCVPCAGAPPPPHHHQVST